jgi:chemotaxis protein MotB
MKSPIILILCMGLMMTSCVSKKQMQALKSEQKTQVDALNAEIGKCGEKLNEQLRKVSSCEQEREKLRGELKASYEISEVLKKQIADLQSARDKQASQVDAITNISKSATDNMKETLDQLKSKDNFIHLLQALRSRADSVNLALAVNLKGVLKDGLDDTDVEVKVDKTVVFVNLSDKMMFQSGSATVTSRANEVLAKIAKIIESKPDLEVMVEGYTDNQPMRTSCMEDNWDLSVKRATSVVRVLQTQFRIDPNRLIAAGRSEFNTLASNDTPEGRSTNRRTRIIILPKLDQFYDLLDPKNAPR